MATSDTARLIASLELKDKMGPGLASANRSLGKLESRAFRVGQNIGTGIKNIARLTAATVTVGAGIVGASLKLAGDFEAQLNTINTIARGTPTELGAIGDSIRKVARDTGTSLEDLTAGYYDLLSAGIKTADAQNVLTNANKLAIGGLSTTGEAINLLTTAINTYGGNASKAAAFTDVFAKSIERGKVTAAELASSFATVGPIAAASGISIQELGAAYARLTSAGVPAAEAATQVRSAIVALTKLTGPLEKLQKATGRNYLQIAGKKGLVVALEQMRKDAKKAGIPLIDLLGRVEGLNFTLATTGPNLAKYNADLAAMGDASGTAAAQMAERQQGLNFQLDRLRALAKDAGITIGTALLPKIVPLIARLNEFVNINQDKVKRFGENIAGLFSEQNIREGVDALKAGFAIARDAAPAIADAAKITGAALRMAVDAFKSLPPQIQALAIGGLAVQKLTGGLVTNLAGGVVDTVTKQFLARGSSPANPVFVSGLGGPGGPGGGKGSGLGGLVGILGLAGLITAAVDAGVQAVNKETGSSFVTSTPVVGNPALTAQNIMQGFILAWKTLNPMPSSGLPVKLIGPPVPVGATGAARPAGSDTFRSDAPEKRDWRHADAVRIATEIEKMHAGIVVSLSPKPVVAAHRDSTTKQTNAIERVRSGIGASLSNHKQATVAAAVAAKNATERVAAAARGTTRAIDRKDLSVTLASTTNVGVRFSIREQANAVSSRSVHKIL